jgi:hypothetical protein
MSHHNQKAKSILIFFYQTTPLALSSARKTTQTHDLAAHHSTNKTTRIVEYVVTNDNIF